MTLLLNPALSPAAFVPAACRWLVSSTPRRIAGTLALAIGLAVAPVSRAEAAANCVDVVLRDPYWSQFRPIVETGVNAAGVPWALARHGFVVDGTPSVGAIVAWPPNYYGASSAGHVGIVADIYEHAILVRHENWPYGSPEWLQVFPLRPGFLYVHPFDVEAVEAFDPAAVDE